MDIRGNCPYRSVWLQHTNSPVWLLTSIVNRHKPILRKDSRAPIQMPPRRAAAQVDNDDTRALGRAVRDVREAISAQVEPDVVQGGVGRSDRRWERDSRDPRSVEVVPDKLRSSRNRSKEHGPIDPRAAGIERPNAVFGIDDDRLHEKEFVGHDAVPRIRLV